MGFGAEVLFLLLLGLPVLGPRQLHAMLGQVARAKAQIENATRGFKSQLSADLHASPRKATRIVRMISWGFKGLQESTDK
jgi:hypothetical protein